MFYSVPKIALLLATNTFQNPLVNLPYASYNGFVNTSNGVTEWLGMRYAAAPVGNLRFAAPQDPPTVSGVQDATKVSFNHFKLINQRRLSQYTTHLDLLAVHTCCIVL